jgi:hypothetical protein
MEKSDVLKSIRSARRSHVIWVDRAKALVNGLKIRENQIPIEVTECSFGKWFYCDGQILLSLFTEEAVKTLGDKHGELHDAYMKIFKIYFPTTNKRSLLAKFFKRKPKISANDEYNALVYLKELEEVSSELVSYLNIMEKKLSGIDEKVFRKLS